MKILGLCTGLLPAAVAAVARSTDEILEFGQQVIAVSIRLAKEIVSRSEYLEGGIGSWGYTIVGADAASLQAILDAFHHNQVLLGLSFCDLRPSTYLHRAFLRTSKSIWASSHVAGSRLWDPRLFFQACFLTLQL